MSQLRSAALPALTHRSAITKADGPSTFPGACAQLLDSSSSSVSYCSLQRLHLARRIRFPSQQAQLAQLALQRYQRRHCSAPQVEVLEFDADTDTLRRTASYRHPPEVWHIASCPEDPQRLITVFNDGASTTPGPAPWRQATAHVHTSAQRFHLLSGWWYMATSDCLQYAGMARLGEHWLWAHGGEPHASLMVGCQVGHMGRRCGGRTPRASS